MSTTDRNSSKRNQSSGSKKKTHFDSWEFVHVNLTVEDKSILRDGWLPEVGFEEAIDILIELGHKVSLTYDSKNDAFLFAVSGTREGSKNLGRTMVGRGGSLRQSFIAFWYRFEVYCHEGKFPNNNTNSAIDFD